MRADAVEEDLVAAVVCRAGRLPAGAMEAAAEASGRVVIAGTGTSGAASGLAGATAVWALESGSGPAAMAEALAPALDRSRLVILPASPDGRDLAPRLAATMGRPLLAGAVSCGLDGDAPWADLLRMDGRTVLPVRCMGPAVSTLVPGARSPLSGSGLPDIVLLAPAGQDGSAPVAPKALTRPDAETVSVIEPEPATMDLSEAKRVFGGGAGLVPTGSSPTEARAVFTLLHDVAAALGASAGATRVVTDAGWMSYERQIGTTGVTIDPDLYLALGVSGASQHVGGIGSPRRTISVNTDPSCPMTAMADLGLVTDALALLLELAARLHVPIPDELSEVVTP